MTRSVDDYVDVAIGILMTAALLIMGVWCWRYLDDLYSQPVLEKTAPTAEWKGLSPKHEYTGKDYFLELVVNDEFCPEPAVVEFSYYDSATNKNKKLAVTYNSDWFSNKEANIKSAWENFFMTASKATTSEVKLVYDTDKVTPIKWQITLK